MKEVRSWTRADSAALGLALLIGIAAFVAAAVGGSPIATVMALFAGSFVLGFVRPKRAWSWALIVWVLAALGAAIDIHANRTAYPWCSPQAQLPLPRFRQSPTSTVEVAAVLAFLALAGAYAGVLCDAIAGWISRLGVARGVPMIQHLQTLLRALAVAAVAGAAAIVGLALIEPIQPHALNDPACWDEYCFSVTSVQRYKTLGTGASRAVASGTFYVVRARMEAPWWGRYEWGNGAVFVLDDVGNTYEYSRTGQRALGGIASARALCHEVLGAAETETLVFDLPTGVVQPRLMIRDITGLEGVMNGLRIGGYDKAGFNLRYDD